MSALEGVAPYPLAVPEAIGQQKSTNSELEGFEMAQNGVGAYTCQGCDNRWSGVSRAHCRSCDRTFGGSAMFDRHRRDVKGIGTCLDPEFIVIAETGRREMFLTAGLWQSVETPAPKRGPVRR